MAPIESPVIEERVSILRNMDFVIRTMQHEMAYEEWIAYVPDGAGYDEFVEIVTDTVDWQFVQRQFARIIRVYGKHGW